MSLGFDRSEWFDFDKGADMPCRHLQPSNGCAIHPRLHSKGQAGCASYDCYGAGQRICSEVFAGVSWRQDPKQAGAMFAAFRRLREVHELLLLLYESESLALPFPEIGRREQLLVALNPEAGFSALALAALDVSALAEDVRSYLRGLRAHLPSEAVMRRRLPLAP